MFFLGYLYAVFVGRKDDWISAVYKQRAWAREGSDLTVWEIFNGATPTTRRFR